MEEKEQIKRKDKMRLEMDRASENEAFARVAVSAFVARVNPLVEQVEDIKTAVSEAVTNAVVHGYPEDIPNEMGQIVVWAELETNRVTIGVEDRGVGIEDVSLAREPFYTTVLDGTRSGMGFCLMDAFMDEVHVHSEIGKGTQVTMKKRLGADPDGREV